MEDLLVHWNNEAWASSMENEGLSREQGRAADGENSTGWEAPGFFAFDQSSSQTKVSLFACQETRTMVGYYHCCPLHRYPPRTDDAGRAAKSPKGPLHSCEI